MKKYLLIYFLLITTNIVISQNIYPHPSQDPSWELVWSDEFEGDSIDTNLWNFHPGWGNCDGSSTIVADQNNHVVANGIARLVSKREPSQCFMWTSDTDQTFYSKNFTSGCLFSKPSFKYGYFEIKSRFPMCARDRTGSGFSPSFWMFPNYRHVKQFHYSEIDIYEIRGYDNTHTCNVHYSDSTHPSASSFPGADYDIPYWDMRSYGDTLYDFKVNNLLFHTYAAEWNSKNIKIFFDDSLIRQTESDILDVNYMLPMNLFISNTANPSNFYDDGNTVNESTVLPYNYDIDHIRVYQLHCDKETDVNEILDFGNYEYGVKKSIILSGRTVLPTNTTTFLRAQDYFELKNGFEVPLGTSLYLIPCTCNEPIFNETNN